MNDVDMQRTEEWLQDLYDHLIRNGWDLPHHVVHRLAFMMAGSPPVYLDTDVTLDGDLLSGTVVVLTIDMVVHGTIRNARLRGPATNQQTFHVETWARRGLHHISLPAEDRSEGYGGGDLVNADAAWDDRRDPPLPPTARVLLHYSGRATPLRLPLAPRPRRQLRTALCDMWPGLLADVSSPYTMEVWR